LFTRKKRLPTNHSIQLHPIILIFLLISWHPSSAQHYGWNWQNPIPQANDLYSVSFTNALHGTAVGMQGTILQTTNGGTTWQQQWSGTTANLRDVCFTDPLTGTIVGDGGLILRTTNGGANWDSLTSGTSVTLTAVSFSDTMNGTAVGS
jgi:photosystem II stability/assembly factor-like uncharacterized protein